MGALALPDVSVPDRSFVDEVLAALEEPRDPQLADLDDEALADELRSLSSVIAASTCRWLVLLAEVVRRGLWAAHGATTPAAWLSWAVGTAPSTAREHVRVALRLRRFPRTTEQFAAGRLSFSKVRAITRTDEPELEELLLVYAADATASQLERIVAGFRATRPQSPSDAWEDRSLSWRQRDDGRTMRITVDLPVEEAREALAVLDRRVESLRGDDLAARRVADEAGQDLPPLTPIGTLRADAWLEAIDALAGAGSADSSGADRHLLVVHADADALTDRDDRAVPVRLGASAEAPTASMSARVLRRLACDTRLSMVTTGAEGHTQGVAGETRRIPSRLRRALLARDGGTCRFPSCSATRRLDGHHIVHWADGGPTTLANLLTLCPTHHRFVHDRDWRILHDGAGHVRFVPPHGMPVPTACILPGASAEAPTADRDNLMAGSIGIHPPDLALAIAGLHRELDLLRAPDPDVSVAA